MSICRVWFRLDGKISVSYPDTNPQNKPSDMAYRTWITQQLDSVAEKSLEFSGLEYTDMDTSELLQVRADRNRWRGDKGTGINIDKKVVLRQDLCSALDKELGKPEPDTINVLRIQRKLNKQEHD